MNQRTLLIIVIGLFITQLTNAQKKSDPIPKFELSAGVGLISSFTKDRPTIEWPSMSLNADYRVKENFSIGAFGEFSKSLSHTSYNEIGNPKAKTAQIRNNNTNIGMRMRGHITAYKKLDLYGGINLGLNVSKIDILKGDETYLRNTMGIEPLNVAMLFSASVGAKCNITPSYGVFGEAGIGSSLLKVGVTRNFN